METRHILAFDYGASSGRAIVGMFDGKRIALNEVHRFANEPISSVGLFWDFESLRDNCKIGLAKASGKQKIDGIAFDTWGVDFGLLNKQGELIDRPFHYRHNHTVNAVDRANKLFGNFELFKATGINMQPFNTLLQLMSMQDNRVEALRNASKLLFIPDLFNYFLTGEKYAEQTICSTSQMAVPNGSAWRDDLLDKAGIDRNLLSNIIPPSSRIGKIQKSIQNELNISTNAVVFATASHDTASAVTAVPASEKDFLFISSGTWSLLGTVLNEPVLTEDAFEGGYSNEGAANGKIRFLKNIMGLWIIQQVRRELQQNGLDIGFAELANRAKAAKAFSSLINPDDLSFYAPDNMVAKIRDYCQKTAQTVPQTEGELARCVFESLAFAYRYALENLMRVTGKTFDKLYIVGGGSNNDLLNQFTANALGMPFVHRHPPYGLLYPLVEPKLAEEVFLGGVFLSAYVRRPQLGYVDRYPKDGFAFFHTASLVQSSSSAAP